MTLWRRVTLASVALCVVAAAPGYQNAISVPDGTPIRRYSEVPSGQRDQEVVFRAATARVRVDVLVTDDDGRFVADLGPGDFTILEDGQPQEILSVQVVDVRRGEVSDSFEGPADAPFVSPADAAPSAASTGLSPAASRSRSELGAVIYLVDGLGLSARNQIRLSLRWLAELESRQSLTIPHALYRIDKIGQAREIVPLTLDIATFREGIAELEVLADTDLFREFRILEPSLQRFGLLREFCLALAGRTGRSALVYVSTGIRLTKGGWPDTRVLAVQEEMHEAANAANVTLYGIDPSLMYELVGTGVDMSRRQDTAKRSRAGSSRDALGDSLRNAASATGGRAFVGWADLGAVIDQVERENSRYYLLTYAPSRSGNDDAYHEIEVEVSRPGVNVRARRGYFDASPEAQERNRLSGAVRLPGVTGTIPVSVEVVPSTTARDAASHSVRVAVDVSQLQAAILEDGTRVARVSFLVAVTDIRGNRIFYRTQTLTHPVEGGPSGDDAAPQAAASGQVTHTELVDLPPGDYELKVVVVDETNDRIGAQGMSILVPEGQRWLP